ncbi:MAG: glycerophosphodiester phosphodiesterase [Actinomycetota bacterium]
MARRMLGIEMRGPRFLAVAAAAAVLALSVPPSGAATPPILIAHRGGAELWPENTMGAFTNAHALFASAGVPGWIELDTQFTSDHVLVVIHDATLDATTDCSGAVVDQPASTVTACDADPGPGVDPVPALAEVLEAGSDGGWRLMIEIKDIPGEPGFDADCNELADALRSAVGAAGFPTENLIVESFWPLCLERLERTLPRSRRSCSRPRARSTISPGSSPRFPSASR